MSRKKGNINDYMSRFYRFQQFDNFREKSLLYLQNALQ